MMNPVLIEFKKNAQALLKLPSVSQFLRICGAVPVYDTYAASDVKMYVHCDAYVASSFFKVLALNETKADNFDQVMSIS